MLLLSFIQELVFRGNVSAKKLHCALRLVLAMTLSFLTALTAHAGAGSESIVIANARIIGGEASSEILHDVLIEGDRIAGIRKAAARKHGLSSTWPLLNAKIIDAKGAYLTPGLIDAHVHLDGVPGYLGNDPKDAEMLRQAREQMPRSYIYFGFTTLLDLTGESSFIAEWNQNLMAPRAHFCTPVTIPNGYPAIFVGKELQFKVPQSQAMLWDPAQANVYPSDFVPEQHSPEAVVAFAHQVGSSCVKVFYETGFGAQRNLPLPSVDLIRSVVTAAHQRHLPVYLHGNSQAAYDFALQTGVDVLVHGLWHENKDVEQNLNQTRLRQMSQELKQASISVQPTIQVLYGEQEETNPRFFEHTYVANAIPMRLRQWYQSHQGQYFQRMLSEQVSTGSMTAEQTYQAMQAMYAKPLATVRSMTSNLHQAGVRLQFGSDTPSGPFYTQFPGMNGRWEMDRWLEAGMSLQELFDAMTRDNAKALGLEKQIGRVAVGMQADLLLMRENPLRSIQAYDQIQTVFLRGKPIQREQLSATKLR